ncbi:MAG TPA: hypothetical protein VLV78_23275 [Thermoanaerobaculia bacterium]|nr:hypothetical protein [Thermoanaerobaculia bacterium]
MNLRVIIRTRQRLPRLVRFFAFTMLAAAAISAFAPNAQAVTYTPTTFTDPAIASLASVNSATGVITGGPGNGLVSLRSAVIAANATGGSNSITLLAGTYQLSVAPVMSGTLGTGTFHKAAYDTGANLALTGSFDVTCNLTITGAGSGSTIIDGGGANAGSNHDLIFMFNPYNISLNKSAVPAGINATLTGLKLQNGKNQGDDGTNGLAPGGAIWFDAGFNAGPTGSGKLTISDVIFDSNTGNTGGGAIVVWDGGTVDISNSTFSNNSAVTTPAWGANASGGAMVLTTPAPGGTVTLTNVAFTGNHANDGGGLRSFSGVTTYQLAIHGGSFTGNIAAIEGGGLIADFATIDGNTVISGNTATSGNAGGIEGRHLTIGAGTVISGNTAGQSGGGVVAGGGSTITRSSITTNTAGMSGGGIYISSGSDIPTSTAAASVTFCRIAGNTATYGSQFDEVGGAAATLTDDWWGTNLPQIPQVNGTTAIPIVSFPAAGGNPSPVTFTTALPHGFVVGEHIAINGTSVQVYNGGNSVVTAVPTPTSFTITSGAISAQPAGTGGTVFAFTQFGSASESGSTVTVTVPAGLTPHGLAVGQVINVHGVTGGASVAGYNGTFVITSATASQFTYTATQTGMPSVTVGNVIAFPSNISTASEAGSTVTIATNGAHGLAVGQLVQILGVLVAGYNGSFIVTTVPDSTHFTYTSTLLGLGASSGGNATGVANNILQLKLTASATPLTAGQTSNLTASFLTDSANNAISTANLVRVLGLPVTWASGTFGTLSGAQATIQPAGTATATFTAVTGGIDKPTAQVDNAPPATTSITIAPTVTSNTASLPANATTITINGTGFDTTPGNNTIVFNDGAVGSVTAATATSLTVAFSVKPAIAGTLTAIVTTNTVSSGAAVQVATVIPVVTPSTASQPTSTTTVVINGFGFDPTPGNNVITFNLGAAGTVTTASTTSLTVTFSIQPTDGNLTAVVTTNGASSGAPVQVATVINPPAIAKAFGAPTMPFNATTSLTFTLSSPNANLTTNGVAFTDSLPAGLVVATPGNLVSACGGTATAADGSTSVTLAGASLAPGASCTVSLNVLGTTSGVKNNSVTVSSTNAGTGNTSNASLTVFSPPTISKAFGAASIPLGGSTSLSFTINNPNAGIGLTGVGFSDTLPAGLVISTPNGATGTCGGGTITATAGTNVISLSGASLAASSSCTFSVNVTGTAGGAQSNTTGNVTSTEGGTGTTSNTATLSVVAPPTIAKAFGTPGLPLNGTTTLTLTITNPPANTVALTGVAVTDALTSGLVVATPNGLANTCGGTATAVAGSTSLTLTGGTIAASGTCSVTINITGTATGSITNTTGAVSSTNGGTGNTASANVAVAIPPTITKSFGAASIPLNGSTTLTFDLLSPAANSIPLTGVGFTDNLPAGLVVAAPNGITNTCGGTPTAVAGATSVSLTGTTLAPNTPCTLSLNVSGTTPGVKNNSVTVTSTEGGTGSTSNASITVVAPPVIIKAFGAASIPLNGSTSLSFTIQNNNTTTTLTGVGFSDTLPAGLVISTPNGATGTCGGGTITNTQGTNGISLTGATLAQSSSCTFSVNVTGTAGGTQNNTTGSVTSTEGGTGGTASASINVVAPPSIAKAFGAANLPLNGTTSLTFTITNPSANTVAETGLAFTDSLPAGLVVATPNGLTNTCGGIATAVAGSGSVSLTGGTIAASSTCAVAINITASTSGNFINTTGAVSSTNGGTGNTATASLAVAAAPTITKSFGAASIPLNGSTSLSFTITSPVANTIPLTGVGFTDNLPTGLVVATPNGLTSTCGGTATAVAGSTSVSLAGATRAPNSSCTVSVNLTGTTAGVKNNSVSVSSTEGGVGNTSNASITVVSPPTISKSFGAASLLLSGSTSLSFTINNPNTTTTLTGIGFSDTLPAGLIIATPNGQAGACGGGTITATQATSVISLSGATLAASTPCTFSVNVTAVAAGAQTNTTGNVTSVEGGTGLTATASVAVQPPDLAVTSSHVGTFTQQQSGATYSITVSNIGTAPTSGTVTVVDALPAGLTATAMTGTGWTCTLGTLTCATSNPLAAGGSYPVITLTVNVANNAAATLTNSVTVSGGGEVNTANDTGTDPTTINAAADVAITKNTAATFAQGSNLTWTVVVTNNGASAAQTVTMSDPLAAGTTFVSNSGATGFVCTNPAVGANGTISCTAATLASGASATFTIAALTPASLADGTTITNTAAVSSATSDPDPANNSATAIATASGIADLAVTKSGPATITSGSNVTWTIVVTNNGPSDAQSVSLSDPLPAGTTFVSESQTTGPAFTCTTPAAGTNGTVTCTMATFASGASAQFSIVATTGSAGVSNTATVSSATNDINVANNSATATAAVNAADVSIAKTVSAPLPFGGQSVTYTLAVANAGPAPATGVTVTDPLPAGTTFVSATPAGMCTGTSTLTCSVGTLASGASATITIVVTAPLAAGSITNTATVSAAEPDPNPANNTSLATIVLGSVSDIPTVSTWMLLLLAALIAFIAMRKLG